MKQKTLMITGGTGYLGSSLTQLASQWSVHSTYLKTTPTKFKEIMFHKCDLRDKEQVQQLFANLKPDVIIHTACSNRNQTNLDSIIPSAKNLARVSSMAKIRLIHISTDVLFDGEHAPYSESDSPFPITKYGRLKAKAEQVIIDYNPNTAIIRPSLIYGVNPYDHHIRWLVENINYRNQVSLFTDEIRCPIWVHTFSLALLELAEQEFTGILHVAGPQALSRWDFGQTMLRILKLPSSPYVLTSTIKELGLSRPRNLTLDIRKAKHILKTPLLSVNAVGQLLNSPN